MCYRTGEYTVCIFQLGDFTGPGSERVKRRSAQRPSLKGRERIIRRQSDTTGFERFKGHIRESFPPAETGWSAYGLFRAQRYHLKPSLIIIFDFTVAYKAMASVYRYQFLNGVCLSLSIFKWRLFIVINF